MSMEMIAVLIASLLLITVMIAEWKLHVMNKKNSSDSNRASANSALAYNSVCDAMTANMQNWQEHKRMAPEVFTLYYKLLAFGFEEIAMEYKMHLTDMLITAHEDHNPDVRKMITMLERLLFLLMNDIEDSGNGGKDYLRYSIMDMINANMTGMAAVDGLAVAAARTNVRSIDTAKKMGGAFTGSSTSESTTSNVIETNEEDFAFAFRVDEEARKYKKAT